MKTQLDQARRLLESGPESADRVIKLLKPLIATHGDSAELYYWFGRSFQEKGERTTALGLFQKALQLKSDLGSLEWEVRLEASRCAFRLGDASLAETHVKESILKRQDHLESWMHLAEIYRSQGELNKALGTLGKANKVDPSSPEVALQIARVYKDQGHFEKALEMLDVVLEMDSERVDARLQKGEIFKIQGEVVKAKTCYESVLEQNPGDSSARVGLAELYRTEGELTDAKQEYEFLLEDYPKAGQIRANYAFLLQQLGQLNASEAEYRRAIEAEPTNRTPYSNYLMGIHYNPDNGQEEILKAHEEWANIYTSRIQQRSPRIENPDPDRPLKVGLLSGGFRQHPVGWMITAALESLSKEDIRLYAYSTHTRVDDLTKRIHRCCEQWRSVVGYTEEQIANLIESDKVDILIELSGHAADNRLLTVARKPAPIAIKWVGGLFNTTGMESMDYLLSDHYETPIGVDDLYTEKLIRMPDDYIVFLPPEYAPDVQVLPFEENGYITFGCLNNPVKVNNELLEIWSQILNRVDGSRLLLKGLGFDTEEWRSRVTEFMEKRGITMDRIIMEGPARHKEFLETYNRIDIALDSWPYSGGLTTCEAMWMGVPVITKPGPTFAGRHSTTHVTNAGHPEWVCNRWKGYVDRAVNLAKNPIKLADTRKGLRDQVASSSLCDGERFARNLTLALREVWRRRISTDAEEVDLGNGSLDVRKISGGDLNGSATSRNLESESGQEWRQVATAMAGAITPVTVQKHPFQEMLIVSLTSYPKRFPTLDITLKSLLNQTVRPDKVILWIAKGDEPELPPDVTRLIRDGLEIRLCDDLRSYKKLLPALETFPDAIHVTADDDIYFWPTWLEELTTCAERYPGCVIAHRVHRIATSDRGAWLPYGMWDWGEQRPFTPSTDLLPTGGAGVLYRPGLFHPDVGNVELIQEVCPKADDLWFYWMFRMTGSKVVSTGKTNVYLFWPGSQDETLWEYNGQDGNDRQISNLADCYGYPELESNGSTRLSASISNFIRSSGRAAEPSCSILENAVSLSKKLRNPDMVNGSRKLGMAQEIRRLYIIKLLGQSALKSGSKAHKPFLKRFSQLLGDPVRSLEEACSKQLFPVDLTANREITIPGLNEVTLSGRACDLLMKFHEVPAEGVIPILHGSMADGKTTPFSDVDLTLWVDSAAISDPEKFDIVKWQRDHLDNAIQRIDPVGHHGSFVQLSTDIVGYPEASMPLDVLESGVILRNRGERLSFTTRSSMDAAFLTLVELCHFFWELPDQKPPTDRFMVKRVISRFFIINLLHYELATGEFTDKRTILTKGLKQVGSPKQLEIIGVLSHIRENWPEDNRRAGGYLSTSLVRSMAEVAGDILADLKSCRLFQRLEENYLREQV